MENQGSEQGEQGNKGGFDAAAVAAIVAAEVAKATAPLHEQIGELRGSLDTRKPAAEPPPPKEYTRVELDSAVRNGTITDIQRDEILERQSRAATERLVRNTVAEAVTGLSRENVVADGIAAYAEIVPDIGKVGSAEHQKVKAQFEYLVRLGQPKSRSTELVALQTVYGSIDALRSRTRSQRVTEHAQEGGGGMGEPPANDDRGDPKMPKLTARERSYYQSMIDKGQYRDWDQVKAELKFASKTLRQKNGLAA